MITLIYDDMYGYAMPEARLEGWVNGLIKAHKGNNAPPNSRDTIIRYGQELILDYFRLAIAEGRLDHNDIQIKYQDEIILINEDGRIDKWPMPSYGLDAIEKLLIIGSQQRLRERRSHEI